jgi:cell wall assembly regulator SMI1
MKEIWQRIEQWLKENAPETFDSLNPGASEEEIAGLENLLSVRLPADMRESYLIHNGQNNACEFIDSRYFFSIEEIKRNWLNWKGMFETGGYGENDASAGESDAEIKAGWYNPKWIPLSNDAAANQNFLDLDPTEKGTAGQIILYLHDDSEITKFVAYSYRDWLENFADDLEFGIYAMVEDGDLVKVEYLEDDEYEEIKADKKSALTKISLPENPGRMLSGEIPFAMRESFSEMVRLFSQKAKKGKSEVLTWGDENYKKKDAYPIIKNIKAALQKDGWIYELGEKNNDMESFKLISPNSSRNTIIGWFYPQDDILILAWVEVIER